MSNLIGLEAWLSDVDVSVHVADSKETAAPVEDTAPTEDTSTDIEPVAESKEEGSDAFSGNAENQADDNEVKLIMTTVALEATRLEIVESKYQELLRMTQFLKEDGLNRSFVKLYTPSMLHKAFGIVTPALESIDMVTSPDTVASQEAMEAVANAAKTAGQFVAKHARKIGEQIMKFIQWVTTKVREFGTAVGNLARKCRDRVLRKDVDPNAEAKDVEGELKAANAKLDQAEAALNGQSPAQIQNVPEGGKATIGEVAQSAANTTGLIDSINKRAASISNMLKTKTQELNAAPGQNAAAASDMGNKSDQTVLAKAAQSVMSLVQSALGVAQSVGTYLNGFLDKYTAPRGQENQTEANAS